ncbi:hypothetical protein GCM10022237_25810 [Nocardioides ginsengisoli]|uniref:Uncharacterized protein n=1 Tax=Nocardioides ginsengisoli TaxID=363868 RepID=A0ABW3W4Z3_9ACTN
MTPSLRRSLPPTALAAALLALAPVGAAPAAQASPARVTSYPAMCAALDLTDEPEIDARALDADDVFAGKVRAAQPSAKDPRRVGYVVAVEESFRGDIAKGKRVLVTIAWPADVNPSVQPDRAYLFFVKQKTTGHVVADACTGSALLPSGLTPRLAASLRRFLASVEPTPPATPTPSAQPVSFHTPRDRAGDPPDLSRVLASGGAISLIGVLGLLLVTRAGRRRG